MSRSRSHSKGPGYDYGGRRPGNSGYTQSPCAHKATKKRTHRRERLLDKAVVRKELADSMPT